MITKEDFFTDFNGHNSKYSSFMLIGATAEQVINAVNKLLEKYTGRKETPVGSAYETEDPSVVCFEACKTDPYFIYPLTRELHCKGFADTAWDDYAFCSAEDGNDYHGFTADWEHGEPILREEGDCYDAFVTVTDNETGITFFTGAGAIDEETVDYYRTIVDEH